MEGEVQGYSVQELTSGIGGVGQVVWNGSISGPAGVTGELREGKLRDVIARGQMTLSPMEGANPVEGFIDLTYNQSAASIDLGQSSVATRYSRAQLAGTLGQRLDGSAERRPRLEHRHLVSLVE